MSQDTQSPIAGPSTAPRERDSSNIALSGRAKIGGDGATQAERASGPTPANGAESDDDGDEDRVDIDTIKSFAGKIQRMPGSEPLDLSALPTSRGKIVIPKRGEKDFEPLEETVNLQEMMLQRSREALFDALAGVRGSNSKAMSHALLTSTSPYPRLLVTRGHVVDRLGISMRLSPPVYDPTAKPKTVTQFLPEEALYLLERGSLQIWIGKEPTCEEDVKNGVGEWKDEEWGIGGAIEMSVMEAFGAFIGKDGLSWERYQAYAYLKRLGYTVQRARQFLPSYFSSGVTALSTRNLKEQDERLSPFRSWWFSLPRWVSGVFRGLWRSMRHLAFALGRTGLQFGNSFVPRNKLLVGTLLERWTGLTYPSAFSHLRIIPTGHNQPLPPVSPIRSSAESPYDALKVNPYLPFFHVWKPATPWTKAKWDKASAEGFLAQKPDFIAAIVDARNTSLPTIQQLAEVFDQLPDEPKGPVKRQGPQYERKPKTPRPTQARPTSIDHDQTPSSVFSRLLSLLLPSSLRSKAAATPMQLHQPQTNPMGALRNGDRALIVAVNDSGNNGWVRFGRTGFGEVAVV